MSIKVIHVNSCHILRDSKYDFCNNVMTFMTLPTVCAPGNFGKDCELNCYMCQNGARCTRKRDGCECRDGWTGTVCNETCPQVISLLKIYSFLETCSHFPPTWPSKFNNGL